MNKRIFVVYWEMYQPYNASANCVEILCDYLKKAGYDVHIISVSLTDKAFENETIAEKYKVIRLYDKDYLKTFLLLDKRYKNPVSKFSVYGYVFLRSKVFKKAFFASAVRQLRALSPTDDDVLIAFNEPEINYRLSYYIKKHIPDLPWITYNFDPFVFNYAMKHHSIPKHKKRAVKYYGLVDAAVHTYGILEENERRGFHPCAPEKEHELYLPNLIIPESGGEAAGRDGIRLIYTGTFYDDIRRPDYFISILSHIGEPSIFVDFYGKSCQYLSAHFSAPTASLPENVHLKGNVSAEECRNELASSNILINIGNKITNQTPSKVLEYVSSGKPIINFYYDENDTSLFYFSKYPLCLNIKIKDTLDQKDVDDFVAFCLENRDKTISAETLKEIYHDYLSENVCKQFEEIIRSVTGN